MDEAQPLLFFFKKFKPKIKIFSTSEKNKLFVLTFSKPLVFLNFQILKLHIYVSGVGKTNAAIAATKLIFNYKINYIINVGLIGILDKKISLFLPILVNKIIYHDVDLTNFCYQLGQLPGLPSCYEIKSNEVNQLMKIFKKNKIKAFKCNIATGDQFIDKNKLKNILNIKHTIVQGIDMELASLMQVCYLNKIQILSIKFGSDYVKSKNNYLMFQQAKDEYKKILLNMLNFLFN